MKSYGPPRAGIDRDRSKSWVRRAMPIVQSHRALFIAALTANLLSLAVMVAMPRVVGRAIDVALVARHGRLSTYLWILVALGLARAVIGYVARSCIFRVAYAIEYDFRTLMYDHLTRQSFSFFDRVQSGQLISRANSDIRALQTYLSFAPAILLQCLGAGLAFAVMLSINVRLALVAMATMPLVYIAGVVMRRRMYPISWVMQARLAEVATVVDENVSGVRVVRSFASEDQQVRALAQAAKRVEWSSVRDADIRARWAPVIENLPRLGLALVLLYGGYLVVHHHTTVGAIVTFSAYILQQLQAPFRMLGELLMWGQRAAASAQRIYEVLDETPEVVERPGAVDLLDPAGAVEFDGVRFGYGDGAPVLDGFSLRLAPGETVALVGRTGSGKSTVARLVNRFYDVDEGAVRLDGWDVRDVTLTSLRRTVGMVLDEPFLFSVSVRDNIAYGRPDASDDDVHAAARAAGADGFVRALPQGYGSIVGERGYTLSGGQRQRLAIARTLLVNPPVLILDDATSAVDVQVEQQIHEALRTLMQGRTTLIIAHRLSTISLADRVVLLDEGRVIAEGTHAGLLATEPRYAEVLAHIGEDPAPGAAADAAADPAAEVG